ncbi:hypothetical protein PCANC_05834 [Puccinia coronata f. sp. avenae]|uniref:Piwi domain-containing protein n=1 Tax=Puccinia coronata f. sp. avenae TaxID=200324 RepID=A0A2N5VBL3_9BASI|nr:hypothetical protein PCANC_05834 [Puccinia coronata f. sp. avenae]
MSPTKDLFHYNIEIFSSKDTSPPIALKKRIFKEIHAKFATSLDGVGPVFDGDKTVYCHKELAPLEGTVEVESFKLPPRKEEFKYILMAVEKPKWRTSDIFHALFGPQGPTMRNKSESDQTGLLNTSRRAMQALNVAIRYLLAVDCPSTSRAFFPDQAPSLSIGGGVLLRRGYITHMRLGNTTNWNPPPDNLFLAMDMTCAAFLDASPQSNPANTLTDLCCKILNVAPTRLYALREDEYRKLHKVLRRFKIDIKRGDSDKGITKSIDHLTLTNSQNEMFETDEGRTSVEAFFLKNWGKRLHYPNLPNVVTMGSGKKTVYPMELCSIRKGQRYILKLGSDQQSSALKFQTIKPAGRFQQIMVARQHVMNSDHEKLLAAYGIRIGKEFVAAQARVLPPPVVEYSANLRIPVRDGQWNIAKPNLQFITPKVLKSWAVVVCTGAPLQDDPIMNFLRALRSKLIQLGVQVAEAPPPIIRLQPPGQNAQVKEALERAGKTAWQNFQKAPPQLFLCITDERSFLYNSIKVEGDNFASRGVTTQCMVLKHVKTPKDQYLSNLALKINLKIGGLNHCLKELGAACSNVPTMIVGADLTHNNLSAKMKPSIAALVGSLDWTMLKYAPAVGVQPLLEPSDEDGRPRSQEPIQLFRTLLTELLEKWEKNNPGPKFPRKMIIFRDGVSDGEFTQVLESEFKAAKAAVEKIAGAPDQCKITYIVCVKNHRLRMSPDPQCQDRSGNAPAGTVLDHRIGDPFLFDFFAQTQAGLQGTSRPTRYVVLKDESNSSADDLQKIIQTISSGFQRATRSVGLATPAYYADIVASRAKMWLNADDDGASTVVSTASGRDQTADERAHDLEMYQNRIQSMMSRLQSLDQQMWWI